jgi:hypothetical protein
MSGPECPDISRTPFQWPQIRAKAHWDLHSMQFPILYNSVGCQLSGEWDQHGVFQKAAHTCFFPFLKLGQDGAITHMRQIT